MTEKSKNILLKIVLPTICIVLSVAAIVLSSVAISFSCQKQKIFSVWDTEFASFEYYEISEMDIYSCYNIFVSGTFENDGFVDEIKEVLYDATFTKADKPADLKPGYYGSSRLFSVSFTSAQNKVFGLTLYKNVVRLSFNDENYSKENYYSTNCCLKLFNILDKVVQKNFPEYYPED